MEIHDYNSSLYPVIIEDQFQAYSNKKLKGHQLAIMVLVRKTVKELCMKKKQQYEIGLYSEKNSIETREYYEKLTQSR